MPVGSRARAMLRRTVIKAAWLKLPRWFRAACPKEEEEVRPDEGSARAKPTATYKGLDLVWTPGPSPGLSPGLEAQKPESLGLVASPGDKQGNVPPWNTTSKQAAFTIRPHEPVEENGKKLPVPIEKQSEDNVLLRFNSAVSLSETRQPLVSPDYPRDGSFEASLTMDMPVLLEPEEKSRNINEVPDYHEDIYRSLREKEVQYKPKAGYVEEQPDITKSMRATLVDWLVMAGEEYKLQNETVHLAVDYTNRFLSSSALQGQLQLVGIAALRLASKFEERHPPPVAELLCLTDNVYTRKEVLSMEQLLLRVLDFDLAAPTINQFLTQYFLHQQQANSKVESLAMFLGDLSLTDADPYLKYLPSIIAGAAFHLALYTVTGKSWPESLIQKTGYTLESLKPCLMDLHQTFLTASQQALQSIQEKYKTAKYQDVSLINPPETLNL